MAATATFSCRLTGLSEMGRRYISLWLRHNALRSSVPFYFETPAEPWLAALWAQMAVAAVVFVAAVAILLSWYNRSKHLTFTCRAGGGERRGSHQVKLLSGTKELVKLFQDLEAADTHEERVLREERCRCALEDRLRRATLLWKDARVTTDPVATVLLQIRISFIKHPYDLIGRRLAAVAKDLLLDVENESRKAITLSWMTPLVKKRLRLASLVLSTYASLLLMIVDVGSDIWVIWNLMSLRLGENVAKGLLNAEAIFNATNKQTLWTDIGKDMARSKKHIVQQDLKFGEEICAFLEDYWDSLEVAPSEKQRMHKRDVSPRWNLTLHCAVNESNPYTFSFNNVEKMRRLEQIHLQSLDVFLKQGFRVVNFSTRFFLQIVLAYLILIVMKTIAMQLFDIGLEFWRHGNKPIFADF